MTSLMTTVLIIGGTSGIGEGFARRLHAQGKKVIITGRRQDRLDALAQELPGLETRQFDITDLAALPSRTTTLLTTYPTINTVILAAGIQHSFSLFSPPPNPATPVADAITHEITTNLTAPIHLTLAFLPHLSALAAGGAPANLLLVSSGLAFVPLGVYPVYCPTKAALHSFCVTLRAQLGSTTPDAVRRNLSVAEIVPPYVDTGLDAAHREAVMRMQGGEKALRPMPLEEYLDAVFDRLEVTEEGKLRREVAVGSADMRVKMWRDNFGRVLEGFGVKA